MVINNLDILNIALGPTEAYVPLVIDSNAPLSGTVATQPFKSVARWYAEKGEGYRNIELAQLTLRTALQIGRKFFGKTAMVELFSLFAGKVENHAEMITRGGSNVKRYV